MKDAWKIHDMLKELEGEAYAATTLDELYAVSDALDMVYKKCWHETMQSKVRVIRAIIKTKKSML